MTVIDLFAGGGGFSQGAKDALGTSPYLAVNHCDHAIQMHALNHPETIHLREDVWDVDPLKAIPARRRQKIRMLWASPDCTHFSRARGGKPRKQGIRLLPMVVVKWARLLLPDVIGLENVREILSWGPLDDAGKPIKERRGETWESFVGQLELLGYRVEWRILNCADYGAPTSRKRLFLLARRDGQPIVWPAPSHGPGAPKPYRTAAECIDWSLPCPSIFLTKAEAKKWRVKRPLAENTQRRIAAGVKRYVLDAAEPFIVRIGHTSSDGGKVKPVSVPLTTITSKNEHLLVVPSLVQSGYGERKGQAPRTLDIQQPLGTIVAGGGKHALVAAFLAKHNGGATGQPASEPLHTITGRDTKAVVAAHLTKFYGSATTAPGGEVERPLPTITGQGGHLGLVAAFLTKYYSAGELQGQLLTEPLHTIPTRDRFGLVTVQLNGQSWAIADIGMRMLSPRELARCQGFPDDYQLIGTKTQQVARIGNSVPPQVVAALVSANLNPPAGN